MFIHVTNAQYRSDYKIWLSFNDGTEGEIDLASELEGEIFESLKDQKYFQSFKVVGHTLSWDNGADFAPEFLYQLTCNNHLSERRYSVPCQAKSL